MPKISCKCGHVINISALPSPDGLVAIREKDFDEIRERLAERLAHSQSREQVEDLIWGVKGLGARNPAIKQFYLCPNCGRLYLFDPPSAEQPAAIWTLEAGDANSLHGS